MMVAFALRKTSDSHAPLQASLALAESKSVHLFTQSAIFLEGMQS
jgi:hypothetical protein